MLTRITFSDFCLLYLVGTVTMDKRKRFLELPWFNKLAGIMVRLSLHGYCQIETRAFWFCTHPIGNHRLHRQYRTELP